MWLRIKERLINLDLVDEIVVEEDCIKMMHFRSTWNFMLKKEYEPEEWEKILEFFKEFNRDVIEVL